MTSSSSTGAKPLRRKLLLALVVTVCGAGGLEIAARIRLLVKYGRASSDAFRSVRDPITGLRPPAPSQDVGAMHFNALGFRGPEIPREKPRGTLRIACIGASTTLCAEVNADADTWPERLAALLRAKYPELAVDVVNAGIPGIGVEESRIDFAARVGPLAPDVVVIYHATNDLSRDTRNVAEQLGLLTERPDRRSFLAEHSVVVDLIEKNLRIRQRQRDAATAAARLLDCDLEALAATFENRLQGLVDECSESGALIVLPTFSTRLRREQDSTTRIASAVTSLFYMPYFDPDRLLAGFAAYNESIRRVAARNALVSPEVATRIPGDASHFVDSVHLTAKGCATFAELVFTALENDQRLAERIAALVASR